MSWKILRVLTTDACNYACIYCHNEGQPAVDTKTHLKFEQFKSVVEKIKGTDIEELRFSGGEPLLNPSTVEMIEWSDANTNYEIGLATNGSLLDASTAKRLASTRVMVTLHLPSISPRGYRDVTGRNFENFERCVALFDDNSIDYSFNHVLHPDTSDNLDGVIEYVLAHGKRLKLLPYIERGFNNFSEEILARLDEKIRGGEKISDEVNGLTWWHFPNGACVKLVNSPCYSRNMSVCRAYGELRLLPNLRLQNCIFGSSVPLSIDVEKQFKKLWDDFKVCVQSKEKMP